MPRLRPLLPLPSFVALITPVTPRMKYFTPRMKSLLARSALFNIPREGVARSRRCVKAHDVRSFHPGQVARSWRCVSAVQPASTPPSTPPARCRGMADTASDERVEAPCAVDSSSNDSARGSAAFTNYYRHQLAPLLCAAASDSCGLLGQPPAFWLRPLGCGQHAVCRSCAEPRFVSQASRVRGKPSRRRCARRCLSPSGSPDGTQPRTRCATRWRQSTPPPASPRRAGRCLGTRTGWRGRPVCATRCI